MINHMFLYFSKNKKYNRRIIFSDPYTAKLSDKSLFPFITDQKAM